MGPFGVATYVKNGLSTIKRELIAQATLCTGRYLTYLWPNDQDSFLRNFFRAFFSLLLFAMNAVFFPLFLICFLLFCFVMNSFFLVRNELLELWIKIKTLSFEITGIRNDTIDVCCERQPNSVFGSSY